MSRYIDERADFGIIRYANCWEDADVLCAGIAPAPGKRILSIASAGDNSLALLAEGAEVVAVDLSPAQLACVELRVAAFRELSHDELLWFLGVRESHDREQVYRDIAGRLSAPARRYWDQNLSIVRSGLIHAGKFESYFHKFRTRVLPWVHRQSTVNELLTQKSGEQRRSFYDRTWNSWRWRMMFKVFFSRFVMGRLGRDPEFFRYVEGSVADRILERTEFALTTLPTHANPYLQFILTGNYGDALPRYLRPEYHDAVRTNLDRLTLFQGSIEEATSEFGDQGFDGYNLSDIFEYLDEATSMAIFQQLIAVARPHARMLYWNMLVPRQCPDALANRVHRLDELAGELFQQDLAFFYRRLVIEEVQ